MEVGSFFFIEVYVLVGEVRVFEVFKVVDDGFDFGSYVVGVEGGGGVGGCYVVGVVVFFL